jgi:hypothetical protein
VGFESQRRWGATAPAEAFDGVWSLAKSVLTPNDSHAVAVRLGLA